MSKFNDPVKIISVKKGHNSEKENNLINELKKESKQKEKKNGSS